ncbi:MAG: TonB-dependent receptor [Bacteroidaceae bacterium]|nr:TonB-dependent receptor [Bacteroidaceae bacterium]
MFFHHLLLNEVTVTSATGETKLKHATTPVSVITNTELRQTTSTNIIDAIARQPGMAQITTSHSISKPIIRGLGYNRVVVMNDGVRQEGQQWGDEHGMEVDGSSIHSVEILKGPASLMYGSDAMAGVLILHSAPTKPEGEMWGNVASEYQTNNGLFNYSLNVAGNQRGFVWDARYSNKMAHAYKNKYDGYVPGSQFREQSGRIMLGLNKHWGYSHLTASLFHQTPSIVEGERNEGTGRLKCATDKIKTYGKVLPFQQVYHYKTVWDNSIHLPHGRLKAIVGYQQNRRQEFEESPDEYELYFRLHTITYDLRYLTQESDGWKLATGVGGMWQQSQNLGEETLIPEYRLFDMGGFVTLSKSLDRWTFNGGLRYDHRRLDFHGRNFNGVTGSAGAVWNVSDHLNLRLNVARGFRAPNMSELGSDGIHEGTLRYEIGNSDLKSEYSWQADLGVDFTSQYVSAQIACFANHIENYIFTKRIDKIIKDDYRTYAYTQGDARLQGIEAGIDLHPIHSIHFQNTFSYVDARQLHADADTRYLPMIPPARWTSELKYEFTHHGKAALNNAYVAFGLECNLAQNHYYRADDTETRTPSYTLISLSAGTDLNIHKQKVAELYITADNLLNRAYQNHLSRLKYTDENLLTGRQGICNMGRNVVFKVIVPMKF